MKQRKPVALIIDDEVSICESLSGVFEDEGWQVFTANSGKQGLIECKLHSPDVVFLDVWMAGMDGIETLQSLKQVSTKIPVIIMSGHATIETAVRATKLGAFDVLEKPLNLEKVVSILAQSLAAAEAVSLSNVSTDLEFIGESPEAELVRKNVGIVGPKNVSVLITGENGTGKEIVAQLIHRSSPRSGKPFVAINCAAIPSELIESELFGHVKGAFTNAVLTKKGKFEMAHGGTLFLDEIGDMDLRTQAKILRAIQEKTIEKVGDTQSVSIDVRIVAATNKDLQLAIQNGDFREDLYYRLNVVPFHMMPLRDRKEDIPLLMQYFMNRHSKDLGEPIKDISDDARNLLHNYPWPGNVRELKNIVERLWILARGSEITVEDLPREITHAHDAKSQTQSNSSLRRAKSDFERGFILDKLEENDWNVSKTADVIGLERSHLYRKLKTFDIDPKRLKG